MVKKLSSRRGFSLVEMLVAIAVLVLLIVGITVSMGSATRVYYESTFGTDSAVLRDTLNTALDDMLRYVPLDSVTCVSATDQNVSSMKTVYFDTVNPVKGCLTVENGYLAFREARKNGTYVDWYLLNAGSYPNLQISGFSLTFDQETSTFTVNYTITNASGDSLKVENLLFRSANETGEYYENFNNPNPGSGSDPIRENSLKLTVKFGRDIPDSVFTQYVEKDQMAADLSYGTGGNDFFTAITAKALENETSEYRFDGFYSDSGYTNRLDVVGGSYTPLGNQCTIYAKWKSPSLSLYFYESEEDTSPKKYGTDFSMKGLTSADISASDFSSLTFNTYEGKYIDRWYAINGSGDIIIVSTGDGGISVPVGLASAPDANGDRRVNIYAHWAESEYTVKFYLNDGSGSTTTGTQKLPCNAEEPGKLKTISSLGFSVTGCEFAGWATSEGSNTVVYTDGQTLSGPLSTVKDATVKLYAVWQATLKFMVNDGTDTVYKTATIKAGQKYQELINAAG